LLKLAYDNLGSAHSYINYTEFVQDFLKKDLVSKVAIVRVSEGSQFLSFARVSLISGEEKRLTLGNVDHFLEMLEAE